MSETNFTEQDRAYFRQGIEHTFGPRLTEGAEHAIAEIDSLRARRELAKQEAIAEYVDDHGMTCDCCQHVMIDVTAGNAPKEKQHCIAGDPEGEGSACASGWHESMGLKEKECDSLRAQLGEAQSTVAKSATVLRSEVLRSNALRSENERLRDALREIEDEATLYLRPGEERTFADDMREKAHAALAPDCEVGAALAGEANPTVAKSATVQPDAEIAGSAERKVRLCAAIGDMSQAERDAFVEKFNGLTGEEARAALKRMKAQSETGGAA